LPESREWISPAVVTFIIDNYAENWSEQNEEIKNIDWYFLPVMNPDGYEYTHIKDRLWRKNRRSNIFCDGVDLNRNYGYQWGGQGASRNPCTETYAGSGPFSEPETKAVQLFLSNSAKNFKASVSIHSYGQYILYPWGYDRKMTQDHNDLDLIGKKGAEAMKLVNGNQYTVGPAGSTLYPAAGGSDDWAKGTMKIKYSYTLELRDTGHHGFLLPASQVPHLEYVYPRLKKNHYYCFHNYFLFRSSTQEKKLYNL
jgi:carboxypeptidase A4